MGYFLGQEGTKELEKQADLKEIALLENVEAAVRPVLEKMAGGAKAMQAEGSRG